MLSITDSKELAKNVLRSIHVVKKCIRETLDIINDSSGVKDIHHSRLLQSSDDFCEAIDKLVKSKHNLLAENRIGDDMILSVIIKEAAEEWSCIGNIVQDIKRNAESNRFFTQSSSLYSRLLSCHDMSSACVSIIYNVYLYFERASIENLSEQLVNALSTLISQLGKIDSSVNARQPLAGETLEVFSMTFKPMQILLCRLLSFGESTAHMVQSSEYSASYEELLKSYEHCIAIFRLYIYGWAYRGTLSRMQDFADALEKLRLAIVKTRETVNSALSEVAFTVPRRATTSPNFSSDNLSGSIIDLPSYSIDYNARSRVLRAEEFLEHEAHLQICTSEALLLQVRSSCEDSVSGLQSILSEPCEVVLLFAYCNSIEHPIQQLKLSIDKNALPGTEDSRKALLDDVCRLDDATSALNFYVHTIIQRAAVLHCGNLLVHEGQKTQKDALYRLIQETKSCRNFSPSLLSETTKYLNQLLCICYYAITFSLYSEEMTMKIVTLVNKLRGLWKTLSGFVSIALCCGKPEDWVEARLFELTSCWDLLINEVVQLFSSPPTSSRALCCMKGFLSSTMRMWSSSEHCPDNDLREAVIPALVYAKNMIDPLFEEALANEESQISSGRAVAELRNAGNLLTCHTQKHDISKIAEALRFCCCTLLGAEEECTPTETSPLTASVKSESAEISDDNEPTRVSSHRIDTGELNTPSLPSPQNSPEVPKTSISGYVEQGDTRNIDSRDDRDGTMCDSEKHPKPSELLNTVARECEGTPFFEEIKHAVSLTHVLDSVILTPPKGQCDVQEFISSSISSLNEYIIQISAFLSSLRSNGSMFPDAKKRSYNILVRSVERVLVTAEQLRILINVHRGSNHACVSELQLNDCVDNLNIAVVNMIKSHIPAVLTIRRRKTCSPVEILPPPPVLSNISELSH